MAKLQDMTTDYLVNLLVTNPANANGGTNSQNTSFPLTLVVNGLLTTPITRAQIISELQNRIAYDSQNPSLPAESYMGEVICGPEINSNGTMSNISVLAPAANLIGPNPSNNVNAINNGGSDPIPVYEISAIY